MAALLSSRVGAVNGTENARASSAPTSAASSPHWPAAAAQGAPPQAPARLVGARGFLVAGHDEPPGFGAYGYLLLLAPPRDSELPRHLSVLAAWLREYPTVEDFLRDRVQPAQISLVQLPVLYEPSGMAWAQGASDSVLLATAKDLLKAYDHARAQALAARLSLHIAGSGPVLVTLPRAAGEHVAGSALVENMSGVAPGLADSWLRASMRAALEPRTWSTATLARLALRMRNVVAQLAAALPDPQLQPDSRVRLAEVASR